MTIEATQNGSVLPVSSRDIVIVESTKFDDTAYKVSTLSYHGRTQLNAALIRSGAIPVTTANFRAELRIALPHIADDAEVADILSILDLMDLGEDDTAEDGNGLVSSEDTARLREIESRARAAWPPYARLYADQYTWNRLYNWEFARRVLCGVEGER